MPNLLNRRITFGGEVIPAYLASVPDKVKPVRKMTVQPIPGTNREVVEMEDAWECYDQPYSFFVGDGSEDSVYEQLNNVSAVLYKEGWQTLVDDYEPDYYRLAYFQGPFNIENKKTRVGTFTVSFRCRAENFLTSGSTEVTVASGSTITNPTRFNSKPLIKITGSGSGTLTVAGVTMSFTGITDYLYIDCDTMNVYRLSSENKDSLMTGEFPVLKPGSNTISFTGGITSCKIVPKWFTI